MKVLQINSFFSAGGPPRIVKGINDMVLQHGDECMLASSREKPIPGMDIYRIGNTLTTYYCAISSRIFDNDGFSARKATKKLINRIEAYNPDIIHIHNLHGYYINIEILFSYLKKCSKPIVWTLHDCWPITGHCPHFSMVKCERYKDGCFHCPQKKDYPSSLFLDQSKRNWERKKIALNGVENLTIVCVSHWLESIVKDSFLKEYNTKVIYNGINMVPFKYTVSNFREKYHLNDKKVLLGVALHWVARKGLYDFIKLAKVLNDDYRIILVGLRSGEVKNLPSKIIPIPPVYSDKELAQIYSASDLYLNLSYEETFGMTSIESLACGTPIITYDLTAVPEIAKIYDEPIIHAGDIDNLKIIIDQHFDKRKNKKVYNVSCFEEKNQYRKYIDLYYSLVR